MTLGEALLGAVVEAVGGVINGALRGMGYSEIELKRMGDIVFWLFMGLFVAVLVGITFVYS